jgi:hypothetical protein
MGQNGKGKKKGNKKGSKEPLFCRDDSLLSQPLIKRH